MNLNGLISTGYIIYESEWSGSVSVAHNSQVESECMGNVSITPQNNSAATKEVKTDTEKPLSIF